MNGPEAMTQARLLKEGYAEVSEPEITPKGRAVRRLSMQPRMPARPEQTSLFKDVPQLPYHAMSPRQFAAQPEVWWHGRYGEDLPRDSYREPQFSSGEWADDAPDDEEDDKSGYYGTHFGTRAAAIHRLTALGPGRTQYDNGYEDEDRIPGRLFPVTLNERQFAGGINRDVGEDWRRHFGYESTTSKGIYYHNEVEDPGSVSAAVPEREGRNGAFFKTWGDHVHDAEQEGGYVHPLLSHMARLAAEHTGEDIIHPDEPPAPTVHPQQGALFRPYSGGERESFPHQPGFPIKTKPAKYLDEDYKNTIGSIKVPGV